MIFVSKKGYLEIVKLLIDSGADINVKDKKGRTALRYAVKNGHLEVVKYLIDKGADDLNEVLMRASRNGHLEVAEFLKSKGAK